MEIRPDSVWLWIRLGPGPGPKPADNISQLVQLQMVPAKPASLSGWIPTLITQNQSGPDLEDPDLPGICRPKTRSGPDSLSQIQDFPRIWYNSQMWSVPCHALAFQIESKFLSPSLCLPRAPTLPLIHVPSLFFYRITVFPGSVHSAVFPLKRMKRQHMPARGISKYDKLFKGR